MSDLKEVVEESFVQYAGAVLQSRALVDVRDCLKPSARQIFYSMKKGKLTADKPFKKTDYAVGQAMTDYYIHGDSSCLGIVMRAAQDFSMRYPLVEVKGNCGSIVESGNWAASRYTDSRLSNFSTRLFEDIEKNTITEWRDNHDATQQYPAVLPSKGFYNIVNGSFGIGIGASSSIPQFNLREVNNALITLLWNPNATFEELYCAPDFCTGAMILNESQIKKSLMNGEGAAIKLKSVMNWDTKDKCFVVTEIPYGVYTNTICEEIYKIKMREDNPGIERVNDLTNEKPLLKIYLKRGVKPDDVIDYLFKNTSLQSHYGINLTMLKDGRFPKLFTWKEALQEHLEHEKIVYRRGFEYDRDEIIPRIHILDGYILACAHIEEIIEVIKKSTTKENAAEALTKNFALDLEQANAILKLTLSRIASLEAKKFVDEKEKLEADLIRLEQILSDETLFKKEIEKGFKEVALKYGDERRTKVYDLIKDAEEEDVERVYYFTHDGKGHVAQPKDGEVIGTIVGNQPYLAITKSGIVYRSKETFKRSKQVFKISDGDSILGVYPDDESQFICVIDEEGHFRCKEVRTLNKTKTSLSLTNLKVAVVTTERASKSNYKDYLSSENKI